MIAAIRKGFALIEIMIVVAIIVIIFSIVIPSYNAVTQTSRRAVCINNLKKIMAAVDQYAIENNIDTGTQLNSNQEDELYTGYIRAGVPGCPSGGSYIIEPIGSRPQVRCTKEGLGHVVE